MRIPLIRLAHQRNLTLAPVSLLPDLMIRAGFAGMVSQLMEDILDVIDEVSALPGENLTGTIEVRF